MINDRQPFHTRLFCVGVRDVRDYRIQTSDQEIITGGSAFNIKATSLRLGNFGAEEVERLYRQHTTETGQSFTEEAVRQAFELTQGQPWLVNALAYEICFAMDAGRNRTTAITRDMVLEAKERLVLRRETHLDQLIDKLKEERVRGVLQPLLTGQSAPELLPEDDIQYVADLGLVTTEGQLRIANSIYREIIPPDADLFNSINYQI